jgi:hypothetical protein
MDHIIPVARGGATILSNLALACSGCNRGKHYKSEGFDPVSGQMAPLYNPRQDIWSDHFMWREDYKHILGLTPTGRVTINILRLNREGVVNMRRMLLLLGLYPSDYA